MTQRLCHAVQMSEAKTKAEVDRVCSDLFLVHKAKDSDDNLSFVRNRLLKSEADLAAALAKQLDGGGVPELAPLRAVQQPNGLWPAVADGAADVSFWASALAVNTLMTLGATQQTVGASLNALVHCRPREASWLVRLKFRLSDRQVRFDHRKYGWPWVPDTVSWVLPTSMALITLERAKRRGWICGMEVENRLRLGRRCSLIGRARKAGGMQATLSSTVFLCALTLMPQLSH